MHGKHIVCHWFGMGKDEQEFERDAILALNIVPGSILALLKFDCGDIQTTARLLVAGSMRLAHSVYVYS